MCPKFYFVSKCFVSFLPAQVEKLQGEVGDKEKIVNSLLGNCSFLVFFLCCFCVFFYVFLRLVFTSDGVGLRVVNGVIRALTI